MLFSLCILITCSARAQFYYKDFISSNFAAFDQLSYKKAGIRNIKLNSFEANGLPSEDFFCEKKISRDFKKSTLYTRIGLTGQQMLENYFDNKGRLAKTYDSSQFAVATTLFSYDAQGRLTNTTNFSKSNDDDFVSEILETHLYHYDAAGTLTDMIRIKNQSDSSIISFSSDDNHHVAVEKDTRTNAVYYYYYDAEGRMTDVTHFNEEKNKMVADYVYEYNPDGQMAQLTTTEAGIDNFVVWKYKYENGLRRSERLFDKDGFLVGKIEYEYK